MGYRVKYGGLILFNLIGLIIILLNLNKTPLYNIILWIIISIDFIVAVYDVIKMESE